MLVTDVEIDALKHLFSLQSEANSRECDLLKAQTNVFSDKESLQKVKNIKISSKFLRLFEIFLPYPDLDARDGYFFVKNFLSFSRAIFIDFLLLRSAWDRQTTPIIPRLILKTRPHRTSIASVPASIRSSFVTTARVLLYWTEKNFKVN